MFPEQTVQAAIDLRAKTLLPVHWGKFALAYHAWNEPIQRVLKQAEKVQMPVLVPQIGMPLQLSVAESQEIWWKM
jgi:L-ascorbate metabolism protein UlaG (beta-lactamase superfamily)